MSPVGATQVKICGITNLPDAERAVELGAWAVGMVFHPPSPRRCPTGEAVAIGAALRRRTRLCGVFVNATLDRIAELADEVGFDLVQLHGDEGPAYCAEVARRTGARVIKAVRVRTAADVRGLAAFHTDYHLLDAHSASGLRGGTGETFDWSLVNAHRGPARLIVSGGLTPENVGAAIHATRPYAVDVASGVEAEPGRKDQARLEAFFGAVAAAQHEAVS
jgi:phosphoribosylanthranilate isomerase